MTNLRDVLITPKDSRGVDAFGRMRVASNHILLSGQLVYADNPLIWDTQLAVGGTAVYSADESAITLTVPDAVGASVIRQTKRYWLYRAGQSQLVRLTFADGDPVAGIRKRIGYFDADDGIFLEINGTTDIALTARTSTSGAPDDSSRVTQDNWNLDPLDGTGPSGITLDFTKAQHLVIDLQWLGVGRARIGFDIAGVLVYAHEFLFANIISGVAYMKTASLPCRYELERIASGTGTLIQICAAVMREGGSEEEGIPTSIRSPLSGVTQLTATTTPRSAIVVRLTTAFIRAFLLPTNVALVNFGTSAQAVAWDLVLNPTLGGAPTYVQEGPASEAAKVLAQQQTYTLGTGQTIASGVVSGVGGNAAAPMSLLELESILGVAADIGGTSDILALIVESASGAPVITASLDVSEQF